MDVLDAGTETAQFFLDMALRKQRAQGVLLAFTGKCHNCDDEVEAPARFCGGTSGCQEDYEKRERIYNRTHKHPVVD